jgi:hypothetical protein
MERIKEGRERKKERIRAGTRVNTQVANLRFLVELVFSANFLQTSGRSIPEIALASQNQQRYVTSNRHYPRTCMTNGNKDVTFPTNSAHKATSLSWFYNSHDLDIVYFLEGY